MKQELTRNDTTDAFELKDRQIVALRRHRCFRIENIYYCRHDIAYLQSNDSHACVRSCILERALRGYAPLVRVLLADVAKLKNNCCRRRARYSYLLFEIAIVAEDERESQISNRFK